MMGGVGKWAFGASRQPFNDQLQRQNRVFEHAGMHAVPIELVLADPPASHFAEAGRVKRPVKFGIKPCRRHSSTALG